VDGPRPARRSSVGVRLPPARSWQDRRPGFDLAQTGPADGKRAADDAGPPDSRGAHRGPRPLSPRHRTTGRGGSSRALGRRRLSPPVAGSGHSSVRSDFCSGRRLRCHDERTALPRCHEDRPGAGRDRALQRKPVRPAGRGSVPFSAGHQACRISDRMSDTTLSVLLVEDDAMVSGWVRMAFESTEIRLAGVAASAAEALALAARRQVDVLLVDYRLPDGRGTELVRDLRLKGVSAPALLMTANAEN